MSTNSTRRVLASGPSASGSPARIAQPNVGGISRYACPKCGGSMVLRMVWGAVADTSFWGCARYPRCSGKLSSR